MIRRSSKIALEALGVVVAGTAVLLGLLAWRLSSGPIEVDFLTPYLESAMSEGRVRLSLGGTLIRWDGFSEPLDIVAVDLRLEDPHGNTLATVPEVELALDVPRLLLGRMAPIRIGLVRPRLRAIRTETGTFAFVLGDPESALEEESAASVNVMDALLRSLRAAPGQTDVPMASLRQLEISGAEIVLDDRLLGRVWNVPNADVTLSRSGAALRGSMLLDIQLGAQLAAVTAELTYAMETDETTLQLGLANFVPSELAGIDPLLEPLAIVATPVFGTITGNFGPGLSPDRLIFVLQGSAGQLRIEDVYDRPVPVAGLALSGIIDLGMDRMVIDRFAIDLGGPSLRGAATITDITGVLDVDASALVQDLPVDLIASYWPEAVAPSARRWVTRNLSQGMVRSAGASIKARIPADHPDQGDLTDIGGSIAFDGVRVNYLDGLPAVDDVAGIAAFDATSFTLALDTGRLRDIALTGADIAITGFDRAIQSIDIELVLSGPARTTLEVIDSPRLGYISGLGLDPGTVTGSMAGRVRFNFPLIGDLTFEQVGIAAAANLDDVGLTEATIGAISGINGSLSLDGRGMTVTGDARIAEIPLGFEWTENFVAGRGFRSRFAASGMLDKADAERLDIDVYGPWEGALGVEAVYTVVDRRRATVAAELDLAAAAIRLDEIGWQKPVDTPGSAQVELELVDGELTAIPAFAIDGAGLQVSGSATLEPESADVSEILLTEFRHGETDLTAELSRLPGGGFAVNAHGPRLDARPLLDATLSALSADRDGDAPPDDEPSAEDAELTPLQVTVAFDEVVAGDGGKLYGVTGIAARDGLGWTEFDLVARTDTGGQVQSRYEPIRPAGRQFSLTAEDAGAALRALDFSDNILGGRLSVTGVQTERGGPLEGSIDLQDYRAVDMPALGRLLAALSLGGLQNVLGTEGLTFDKLTGEYRFADDTLYLRNARTAGGALGLTLNGEYDIEAGQLDLEGTIVPIYGVNQLIGAIPLLGDLLTGGSGQGIFAFAYSVEGPLREPEVAVNPLSVLAPGFIRNLFFLDSGLGQPDSEVQPRRQLNDED